MLKSAPCKNRKDFSSEALLSGAVNSAEPGSFSLWWWIIRWWGAISSRHYTIKTDHSGSAEQQSMG